MDTMAQFNKATADNYANGARQGEGTLRAYQQEGITYTLGYAQESSDYNQVAVFISKLAEKSPTKAKDIAEWVCRYFPLQVTGKDNKYNCKAVKVRNGVYNLHQDADQWKWELAAERPFWITGENAPTEKPAEGRSELVKLLRKWGSDKRVNEDKVTADAAKDANEFATLVEQRIAKASLAEANALAEAKATKAANRMLEQQQADAEAEIAELRKQLAAATAPVTEVKKAATAKPRATKKKVAAA